MLKIPYAGTLLVFLCTSGAVVAQSPTPLNVSEDDCKKMAADANESNGNLVDGSSSSDLDTYIQGLLLLPEYQAFFNQLRSKLGDPSAKIIARKRDMHLVNRDYTPLKFDITHTEWQSREDSRTNITAIYSSSLSTSFHKQQTKTDITTTEWSVGLDLGADAQSGGNSIGYNMTNTNIDSLAKQSGCEFDQKDDYTMTSTAILSTEASVLNTFPMITTTTRNTKISSKYLVRVTYILEGDFKNHPSGGADMVYVGTLPVDKVEGSEVQHNLTHIFGGTMPSDIVIPTVQKHIVIDTIVSKPYKMFSFDTQPQ